MNEKPLQFRMLIRGLFLLGALSLTLVLCAQYLSSRKFEEHVSLIQLNQTMQQDIATAHVWFEEALGGDESIDLQRDVYLPLENAINLIDVTLTSVSSPLHNIEDRFPIRSSLTKLRDDLTRFKALAVLRWASRDTIGAIGGAQDQQFDALFGGIIQDSRSIANAISEFISLDQDRILFLNIGNLLILFAIYLALAVAVMRYRRIQEGRSQELERLVAKRTDSLAASEAEARQRSEELIIARDEARAASQAKSQFLANMGHEIRTPMNGVLGIANLLSRTSLTPTQQKYVDTMQSSGLTLLQIINDILDYSKIEAGKMTLKKTDFRMQAVINDTLNLFSAVAAKKHITLSSHMDPAVPEQLRGDPIRLGEIFSNLVSNAIKFSNRGDIRISTRLADSQIGHEDSVRLRVEVTDQGIGVKADYIDHLFDHFSQADDSSTRQHGGTGLGLAICRELVKLMDGEIGVHNNQGDGSTFWFEVSLERVAEDTQPQTSAASLGGETALIDGAHRSHDTVDEIFRRRKGERVLVVDDNETNLLVAQHMLCELGFEVELTRDGTAAIEATRRSEFAAILVDSQMPGMDGNETTRILRAIEPAGKHTPIIALTANILEHDRTKAFEAGVDDYLRKPLFLADLKKSLAGLLADPEEDAIIVRELPSADEIACAAVLDESVVAELISIESALGDNLFTQLTDQVMQQIPEGIEKIRNAAATNDYETIRRHSHMLRGSLHQIGANRLALTCRTLETDGADLDSSQLTTTLNAMWQEYQMLKRELARRNTEATAPVSRASGNGTSAAPLPALRRQTQLQRTHLAQRWRVNKGDES